MKDTVNEKVFNRQSSQLIEHMDSIASRQRSPKTKRWAYNMTRDEFVILIRRSQIHVRESKGRSSDRRNIERFRVLDPREDGSPRLGRSGMYYAWRPLHQNWSFPRHRVAHRCQGREMSIFFVFDVLLMYARCVKKKNNHEQLEGTDWAKNFHKNATSQLRTAREFRVSSREA